MPIKSTITRVAFCGIQLVEVRHPLCGCGEEETTEHYILHCHIYDNERAKLAVQLKTIDESLDLLHLLTRDSNKEKHKNKLTFLEEFIKSTGCFPELASPVPRS